MLLRFRGREMAQVVNGKHGVLCQPHRWRSLGCISCGIELCRLTVIVIGSNVADVDGPPVRRRNEKCSA
jgi:hypothetical protein